jgi:secondary thiamine-phosphate synthase enzyme
MKTIKIRTEKKKEVRDITSSIENSLKDVEGEGLCHLFLIHTTAALTTADLDPGTDLDMLDALREMVPRLDYRHPHNPSHLPDHLVSSLIGTSLLLPVKHRKLILGTWQRVVLVELDGPRQREVVISFLPAS